MSTVSEPTKTYVDQFNQLEGELARRLPSWWLEQKRAALTRFSAAGFPDPRQEEWKYTNVRPITKKAFLPAQQGRVQPSGEEVAQLRFPALDAHVLVFVNGRLNIALSQIGDLPAGVRAMSLGEAIAQDVEGLSERLGAAVSYDNNSFAALNTAFAEDGAYIELARDTRLEWPVHLIFLATNEEEPVVAHPRVLVAAGAGSEATVVEHYMGQEGSRNWNNAVTEVLLAANASLEHYLLQQESIQGYHVGSVYVRGSRDSRYTSHNVNLGGRLVRNDLNASLLEPGARAVLNGLFMVGGRQHVDNHTRVHHAAPHTSSEETYRGVGDGHGRGVFKGRVWVDRDAQKVEAHQNSANLLLSENAEIDTKPELEIYADDVACSHGATVGQLDEDSLFYLRSRAIDQDTARGLLIFAFADEVVERLGLEPVRAALEERIAGRLPDSDKLKGFV